MKAGPQKKHIASRWGAWIRSIVERESFERGLDESVARAAIAASIALDSADRNSHPRSDVSAWMRGEKFISAARAFDVGQRLGHGGALALLAAGHFDETIALIHRLIIDGLIESATVVDDPRDGPGRMRALAVKKLASARAPVAKRAHGVVAYAIRFVGSALTALADLDEIDAIGPDERTRALERIGPAPIDALAKAFERTQYERARKLAPLISVRVDRQTLEYDGPLAAALLGWCALAEMVAQHVACMPAHASTWRDERAILDRYLDHAHAANPNPLLVSSVVRQKR